ncbi:MULTISPECIES: HIRAN domain-containing protein [unclassified Dysgonomonas]|uniref:HIRAN domain-containing protein n=1 Tax=unclassified Dysgonomonas TaxID=2630389 RepID=UPI0025B9B59A|nr:MULTISPECIES: HIRAN domain-containing protein [unclassified Dysgonomonas]HMM02028.1 HIRAN domain-containing protein [Dysgonomonas sp.]
MLAVIFVLGVILVLSALIFGFIYLVVYQGKLDSKRTLELHNYYEAKKRNELSYKKHLEDIYTKELSRLENKRLRLDLLRESTNNEFDILFFELAGLYYRSVRAKKIANELEAGDFLELKREPSNQFDSNAVKVLHNGIHIGYVPIENSEEVSNNLKNDSLFYFAVIDFTIPDPDDIATVYIRLFPREGRLAVDYFK